MERKVFSCDSLTLISFLSVSQLHLLKLSLLFNGELLVQSSRGEEGV